MSIRGNGRWILWICGAGAIAALVTAAVSWKDIVSRYHLAQLRRDPALLPSFLDESAGATKKLAARVFARQPIGRRVVVSLFIDYFAKAREHPRTQQPFAILRNQGATFTFSSLVDVEEAILGFREAYKARGIFWYCFRWRDDYENSGFIAPEDEVLVDWEGRPVFIDAARLSGLAELLVECRGPPISLPQYPGLTVEALSVESAIDRTKGWPDIHDTRPFWTPANSAKPHKVFALLISRESERGAGAAMAR